MAKGTHRANVHGAAVGKGGLMDQMAPRKRQDGETVGGEAINSTSIFDPVLAELLYRWFCPATGIVLDPFAGGSVRGIVAARLGRAYHGIDLRPEQVIANRAQAVSLLREDDPMPTWYLGDSNEVLDDPEIQKIRADFVMTCPPYADLEVYSDDPRDISTMKYDKFFSVFSDIMGKSIELLDDDRFIALVVGDARGKDGAYYGFPAHCVGMMQDHGVKLWNEQIIVTPAGTLPGRSKLGFERSRKTGRGHQSALIFLKGDPKKATEACGVCQFGQSDPLADLIEPGSDDPLAGLGKLL